MMGNRVAVCRVLVGAALLLLATVPAVAAPPLRPDMVHSLETLQQRLAQGSEAAVSSEARQAAERLEGGNAADRWARALFLQLAASAEARQGNDARAADLFARARGIDAVDRERRRQWLDQEARLRLRAGQTEAGAELLARWLDGVSGSADDFWLMARTLASLQRWDEAAGWADRARQVASPTSDQSSLAATIYQRAGRDDAALAMLDDLLARDSGSADSWRRAAGLAQRLGQPGRAAALWEAAWRRGVLQSEQDLRRLVQLHLAGGTPARGAERLAEALAQGRVEDSLDTRRLLAEAWGAARERDRALAAWRDVAQRSHAARDWQQLAELAYGWGRWQVAVEALRQARGAGEASPRNWLLEGVAQLERGQREAARRAFEAARQAGSAEAQAWLAIIDGTQSGRVADGDGQVDGDGQG